MPADWNTALADEPKRSETPCHPRAVGDPMHPRRMDGHTKRAQARVMRPCAATMPHNRDWSAGVPSPDEQATLSGTLGTMLRRLRMQRRLSTRRLAVRSAVAQSTIQRLEAGQCRPRPAVLRAIAYGLEHQDPDPLAEGLIVAAGASLRPDTPAGLRRRRRIERRRRLAADRQRGELAKALQAAREMHMKALMRSLSVLGRRGALDRVEDLEEAQRLHDAAATFDCRARAIEQALGRQTHPLEEVRPDG